MAIRTFYDHEHDRHGRYEGAGRPLAEQAALPSMGGSPGYTTPAGTREHTMGLTGDEDYGGELALTTDPEDYGKLQQRVRDLEERLAQLEERRVEERRAAAAEALGRDLEEAASPDWNLWEENIITSGGSAATDWNMPRTRDKQLAVRGQAQPVDDGEEDQDDFEKEYLAAIESIVEEFNPHDTDEQGGEKTDISKKPVAQAEGKTSTGKGQNVETKK